MKTEVNPFFRAVGILMVVGALAFGVWTGGNALRAHLTKNAPHHPHSIMETFEHEAHGLVGPDFATHIVPTGFEKVPPRSLKTYYSRRAYPGAPPIVPHEISDERLLHQNCNTCHEKGGYVPKWNAYTPVTPHPEYENCLQCHAPGAGEPERVFSQIDWAIAPAQSLHRPALPGAPPPIPHSLQLRENCLACHAGPAAPVEIRTGHPERVNCVQCHAASFGLEEKLARVMPKGLEIGARAIETVNHGPVSKAGQQDRPAFQVETRADAITAYPCSSCHDQPQAISSAKDVITRSMHLDLSLAHADSMSCGTCHNDQDLDTLNGPTGKPLSFDHAYELCSTCHFEQARDWAGGAHGKRLVGWQADRVVKNCTGCHDPHAPRFEPRWPAARPQIPRLGDRAL